MAAKTRFRIFLQPPYVQGFEEPATVEIETEDQIEAGPADSLFYVLDAENKPSYRAQAPHAYQRFRGRPWKGARNRRIARPDHDGHFDHLAPDDPTFPAASVYAAARLTLNFWNRIFNDAGLDQLTAWHHDPGDLAKEGEDDRLAERLQLIPRCASTGSRTGYGYLEVGQDNPGHRYRPRRDGPERLTYQRGAMWQNFDVIAHEVGHAILFRRVGFPASADDVREWFGIPEPEFLAFHESMADLVAILSLLDAEAARQFILTRENGIDIAAGVGELQRLDAMGFLPIRSAKNESKYPGPGRFKNQEAHTNSMSLTGAVFDTLKRVYEVRRVSSATAAPVDPSTALAEARDIVARALARLWANPEYLWEVPGNPSGFSFIKVSKALPTLLSEEFERQGHGPASQGTAMSDPKGALRREAIVEDFAMHGLG